MPHPLRFFGDNDPTGSWLGLSRVPLLAPPPQPTYEERVQRCTEMGLLVCSCRGVETDRGRKLLYVPSCPVHKGRP
jgi:hypothetical protein